MTRAIPEFLYWCAEHGIEIDRRLEIRMLPLDGSMSVFSKPDTSIAIGESLVRIPKSTVLSTKNCSRSRDIPSPHSLHDPILELSLTLLTETLIGPESRWHGYLQSLPVELVEIAVFWGVNNDQDGVEARKWLQGTEVEKLLVRPDGRTLLDRINEYFEQTARQVLDIQTSKALLQQFYRAYSLVSSRAFLVDAYHGLSLVPIADAFNHVEDNHVHLESDYHVCATCGSLTECPHDTDSIGAEQDPPSSALMGADTCEMVANLPIGASAEVFNTYEKGLTNAQLLCQYGFTLDVNENNLVTWSIDDLLEADPQRGARLGIWANLVHQWPKYDPWDDLQLVYNLPNWDKGVDEDGVPKRVNPTASQLNLNADGQLSHPFWLMLVTFALPDANLPPDQALSVAQLVARTQEQLELGLTSEVTILGPGPSTFEHRPMLRRVAASAIGLCETKLESAHCPGTSEACLGDILDETPWNRPLTRRAIAYALEERKLLQACRNAWLEIREACTV